MKRIALSSLALSCALFVTAAQAQTAPSAEPAHDHADHAAHGAEAGTATHALSEGEVVRWDAATGRLTLRHGEIANLAMPPMTMVFRLRQAAPAALAPGVRVRFHAEDDRGALVITRIEVAG